MLNSTGPVYLQTLSPGDKPWDVHRAQAETVERLYEACGYDRYCERVRSCSGILRFAMDAEDAGELRLRLKAARFCRVRFCPVCQWRRSLMWKARFYKAIPGFLEEHPKLIPVFLTLTVRNCSVTELRDTIGGMNKAFTRLTKRKQWPGVGWVKSVEVTRNPDTGEAHPHFHVLMFVRPSYFAKGYVRHSEWQELWKDCLRVGYLPVVNVKRVKTNKSTSEGKDALEGLRGAIMETLKYGVKPEDLVKDASWLEGITRQLHKTRSVAVGGALRPYLSEEEPEDLIHGDEPELVDEDLPMLIFDWAQEVKKYILSSK